jgi:ferritin-like metal-binding protein YciE
MELNSLTDVLIEELGDLHSAEQQLLDALPKLAAAAHSYELREALESHLKETTHHVERLDQAFAEMGIRFAPTKMCQAMKGWSTRPTTSLPPPAIQLRSTQP